MAFLLSDSKAYADTAAFPAGTEKRRIQGLLSAQDRHSYRGARRWRSALPLVQGRKDSPAYGVHTDTGAEHRYLPARLLYARPRMPRYTPLAGRGTQCSSYIRKPVKKAYDGR